MSLTNYLLQSVIGCAIFCGYGLACYRYLGVTYAVIVGCGMVVCQYLFARYWFSNHPRGPLESYYKFIKNNGKTDKPFWQFQIGTRQHDTWAGLAFEQLCLNHHKQIEQALGIAVISTKVYSWTTPQSAEEKAQIDLIIKRADKVINICEMKFYDGDYVMKKKDHEDIERRVRAFRTTNGIRQAIHPVLVTTYGLANNQYSSIFQNVVTLKDLFK
jgi:hypothetical protein